METRHTQNSNTQGMSRRHLLQTGLAAGAVLSAWPRYGPPVSWGAEAGPPKRGGVLREGDHHCQVHRLRGQLRQLPFVLHDTPLRTSSTSQAVPRSGSLPEESALMLITPYPWSAPREDVRLKKGSVETEACLREGYPWRQDIRRTVRPRV